MTFDEYKKLPGINASFLKACHQSPFDGWHYLHNPPEPSDAMAFGTAVHTALIEPSKFNSLFAISSKFDKRTKAGKEAAAAFEAEHAGKIIIDEDQWGLIIRIRQNCKAIPHVAQALASFEKEKTFIWDGFKARLDLVSESTGAIIDIKTTRDASERGFLKQVIDLRYDIQMLHYSHALGGVAPNLYAIAIENTTGQVACYDITNIVYSDFTKKRYEQALITAQAVMGTHSCPAKFKSDVITLKLPNWAIESEEV